MAYPTDCLVLRNEYKVKPKPRKNEGTKKILRKMEEQEKNTKKNILIDF
jgi:hypothetical protein